MRITFPRKKGVKTSEDKALYVVLGRGGLEGQDEKYWIMDFWELPYTFSRYANALVGEKAILKEMMKNEWHKPETVIAKIIL